MYLLTVPEVAERIRVSPELVRRWLRQGRLRGVRLGGTRLGWRILDADLERFLVAAGLPVANALASPGEVIGSPPSQPGRRDRPDPVARHAAGESTSEPDSHHNTTLDNTAFGLAADAGTRHAGQDLSGC